MIVFSFYTTWYTTERCYTVSTRDICRTEAKTYTRQIIIKVYSSIFQRCGLAALFAVVVSQWIHYQILPNWSFIILRKMKINKPIEFVSLETVFIEIERSKVSVSTFIIFKNMD